MTTQPMPLAEALQHTSFLDELHAFLWTDPFLNQGMVDHGWSCRDHTLVVGQFLVDAGASVTVRHGKCMFVQGPTSDGAPPVGVGQDVDPRAGGHTWLSVDGLGDVDLSPKLKIREPRWRPIESPGIVGSVWVAMRPTHFFVTDSPGDYDQEIAKASHARDEWRAIYFKQSEQSFAAIADQGLSWANSRVSLRLLQRGLPDDLYGRFAAHLHGVLAGDRRPLGHLSRNKAWAILADDADLSH
jgi:hypothetical protein